MKINKDFVMKNFVFILFFLGVANLSYANTVYVSSDGTGDGYDIERPANLSDLNGFLADASIANIILKSGIYYQNNYLSVSQGSHPVKISGLGNVIITSDYNSGSGGSSGFIVARSNINFENIKFINTQYCFRFKNNTVSNVNIDRVYAHNTMSCVDFDSGISEVVSNITINELTTLAYHKSGIRINGDTPTNISITNSKIDGLDSNIDSKKDCHITGISVSGKAKDIHIENVSISNNIGGSVGCGSYQQGDGIVINSDVADVTIKNVLVSNSRDADLDIKSQSTILEEVTSLSGDNNRHNLKLWYNDFSCKNCYIKANKPNAIQAIGSRVEFVDSVFEVSDVSKLCDLRERNGIQGSIRFVGGMQLNIENLSMVNSFIPDCT